jgi:hypothetical protein
MLFVVIERFKGRHPAPIYARVPMWQLRGVGS